MIAAPHRLVDIEKGWELIAHVRPIDDLIDHSWSESCICGPSIEEGEDANLLIIHASLDGRELLEQEDDEY